MIITFIFIASLFTAIGFLILSLAGLELVLIVPITGFAHAMMSAALEYRRERINYGNWL